MPPGRATDFTAENAENAETRRIFPILCVLSVLCGEFLVFSGCRGGAPKAPTVEPAGRFPHALAAHAALACTDCHAGPPPGHGACARCHPPAFDQSALATAAKSGPLCAGCHEPHEVRRLASRFSHRVHLDRGRMEQAAGFHPACEDCHAPAGIARARANHEACARCHAQASAPLMADCTSCHGGTPPVAISRQLVRGDLRFSHAAHEFDRVGRALPCLGCHENAANARTADALAPPQMTRCTQCHDDPRQTTAEARMSRCPLCHLALTGPLAPRSHQLGTLVPDDHTLLFRRDHTEAARAAGARCVECHQGLSGSLRDSCAECHAVMRPRDHTITWRESDHGIEAASARERCAECHSADSCEACHRVPPRSHLPRAEWAVGHGRVARLELRACFACHTFEGRGGATGCAPCHARGLR